MTLPILYILMRNDMDSMNPGKGMAQASHASNAFVKNMRFDDAENEAFIEWQNSTDQGFGTVIVLQVNEKEMRETNTILREMGYVADIIHDPTYPLIDGNTIHYIPVDTCSYVFVEDKNDANAKYILKEFSLHI